MSASRSINDLQQELYSIPLDFKLLTVEFIQNTLKKITDLTNATYSAIAMSDTLNFETIVQPLINLEIFTNTAENFCKIALKVHTDENVRKASQEFEKAIKKLKTECNLREDVYQVFQKYENGPYKEEEKKLHQEQNRYFNLKMRDYKRSGVNIRDSIVKNEIIQLKKEIEDLCSQFNANLRDDKTKLSFSRDELEGVDKTWFTKEREVKSDYFETRLLPTDISPILKAAKNREIRKKAYLVFSSRSAYTNLSILTKIIKLRNRLANLLGYKTYLDFTSEIRMAKTSKNIQAFLNDLRSRLQPLFHARIQKLTDLAKSVEHDQNFQLQNYDFAYYENMLLERALGLNMKEFMKYFSLNKVINETFRIYENLLGLRFVQNTHQSTWHEEVRVFDVYDCRKDKEKTPIGQFFLDLHSRPGKATHVENNELIRGADVSHLNLVTPNKRQLPVVVMICNYGRDGQPLGFTNDVVSFFHEFGHVMHYICAQTKLPSFHAFATETDFIEAPSQMLENWCYDYRILKLLSAHPETGEPIPIEMLEKLNQFRIDTGININTFTLMLSYFDYHVHSLTAEELNDKFDVRTCFQQIQRQIRSPLVPVEDECRASSFAHMTGAYGDYDGGYFGYLMANTFAADMFATKFVHDPLSHVAGAEYREKVLEPGSTLDGMDILKNYLGRNPSSDPFIESVGLHDSKKSKHELSKSKIWNKRNVALATAGVIALGVFAKIVTRGGKENVFSKAFTI